MLVEKSERECDGVSNFIRSLVGEWLSLVEHLVRDQGVGGSNPLSPTISFQALKLHSWFSVYIDGVEIVDGTCIAVFPASFTLSNSNCFSSEETRVNF